MPNFICVTCGAQFAESPAPPPECPICGDSRQYIGLNGQQWTTLEELKQAHHNRIETVESNLTGIGTEPTVAIGQRGLLVQTPRGNVLWDCPSLLDDGTMNAIKNLGGIAAIAVSHPHLAGSLVDYSHAFRNARIYWHASNREWVTRPDPAFVFWEGDTQVILDGLTLILCGGHFAGSDVLHWRSGAEGRGVLLAGDTIQVASDRRFVSFMYSYPNMIPLNARAVERIVHSVEPFTFDRLYGGWWHSIVPTDAKNVVKRSAARYVKSIAP